jgi:hypothetical protein
VRVIDLMATVHVGTSCNLSDAVQHTYTAAFTAAYIHFTDHRSSVKTGHQSSVIREGWRGVP